MKYIYSDLSPGETMQGLDIKHQRLMRLKSRRKIWLDVHLWLGLILGFFLALFGITGSILVFYDEIDAVLNANLHKVQAQPQGEAAFRPFAEIQAAAVAVMPGQAKLGFVDYPGDAESAYEFGYTTPADTEAETDEWQVHVDPYRAKVLGKHLIKKAEDSLPRAFIPFVFQLHYTLLAGETGVIIVGIMGIILLFSVLTGLIVWWPLTGHWRRAVTIKHRASVERFNHDLHQISGFYVFPVLLAVLLSGVYMNLPAQFMALVKQLSPGTQGFMDSVHSSPAHGQRPIGLAQALNIARSRYPGGRVDWLGPADGETGAYVISISDVPGLSHFWSERLVTVDQYNGAILQVRDPGNRLTAGQTFIGWQWPLHSGKAFGWTGRIIVFVAGLACPVLFLTGFIRWLQKRRASLFTKKNLFIERNRKNMATSEDLP